MNAPRGGKSPFSQLSAAERDTAIGVLAGFVNDPFLNDYELQVLLGKPRKELTSFVTEQSSWDNDDIELNRLVGLALLNVLHFPHGHDVDWEKWMPADRATICRLDERWTELLPPVEYSSIIVYGPVRLNGRFYRAIEATRKSGGGLLTSEVWKDSRWQENVENDAPGYNAIRAEPIADDNLASEEGVMNTPPLLP